MVGLVSTLVCALAVSAVNGTTGSVCMTTRRPALREETDHSPGRHRHRQQQACRQDRISRRIRGQKWKSSRLVLVYCTVIPCLGPLSGCTLVCSRNVDDSLHVGCAMCQNALVSDNMRST